MDIAKVDIEKPFSIGDPIDSEMRKMAEKCKDLYFEGGTMFGHMVQGPDESFVAGAKWMLAYITEDGTYL